MVWRRGWGNCELGKVKISRAGFTPGGRGRYGKQNNFGGTKDKRIKSSIGGLRAYGWSLGKQVAAGGTDGTVGRKAPSGDTRPFCREIGARNCYYK